MIPVVNVILLAIFMVSMGFTFPKEKPKTETPKIPNQNQ
jgi:hypothetical protein